MLEPATSYNVAPSQHTPVCHIGGRGGRSLAAMKWGFTLEWSKDGNPTPINARCETAAASGMFKAAFAHRRCLVPVSGFYEWKKEGGTKQPYLIRLLNDPIFCLAGLWETHRGEDGRVTSSYAILTTRANALVAKIHDRMPVIIRPRDFDRWLLDAQPPQDLFEPFPAEEMESIPISRRINSPHHDDASLIRPIPAEDWLL